MSDSVGGRKESVHGTRQKASRVEGVRTSETSVYKSSAEVSVRHKSSEKSPIYKGIDDCCHKYSCDPCNSVGDHIEAQGFCTDCEEYLCVTCYKSHPRNKASRHHNLLDKESMPKESAKYCDPCKHAGDEAEAAGYCINCEDYLCSTCFKSHSRNKASRHHVLLDKDNMPSKSSDLSIVSSVEKVNISRPTEDAEYHSDNEKYSYLRDINVKVEGDENVCAISGMVLMSDTELVLVDKGNKALKFIDIEKAVIKDNLKLSSRPYGITLISKQQVAVALGSKSMIHIISTTSSSLSIIRTLKTDGICVDIKYINRKLYVSYCKPVKIQILQLTGEVYTTIQPDSEVLKLCTLPRYIAVSPDENSIYMSDWERNKVIRIDMKGRMISVYKGVLAMPGDIAISPFKSVYLCNMEKDIICKMTSDLSDITTILHQEDGLNFPRAMCFNNVRRHLYISSGSGKLMLANCIKVYQWN